MLCVAAASVTVASSVLTAAPLRAPPAVMEGALASELRQFMLDDQLRRSWDDSTLDAYEVGPGGAVVRQYRESGAMYARTKFPAPMASREYVYARRVWNRWVGWVPGARLELRWCCSY
jgi:hypothetical protein